MPSLAQKLTALALLALASRVEASQNAKSEQQDPLKHHYEAAGRFERSGDQDHAIAEYRAFLAEALHRVANGEAEGGHFDAALPLFAEAWSFAASDENLRLDYARVSLDADKLEQARTLAEEAVQADPRNAQARFLLGRALFHLEDYNEAKKQLEVAVSLNPDFETGYLLGRIYLLLHEEQKARTLFDEMVSGLGDSALIHIYFGRAFSLMDYPDQAEEQFHKAMAIDPRAPDVHYGLALAYLRHDESAGYSKAVPEFQAELKNNPNDVRSHYMLGYIGLKERNFFDAEKELGQALALQPQDVNTLISLAEVYAGEDRVTDAEATLRKAIQLGQNSTGDQNQVKRAHYLLGRLLVRTGRQEEAKQEMRISGGPDRPPDVASGPAVEARMIGSGSLAQEESAERVDKVEPKASSSDQQKRFAEFRAQLSPVIGEVYNDLGASSAGRHDFVGAVELFEKAKLWSPELAGLDRNLGMAAFYAEQYDKAAPPLGRYLAAHPEDSAARAAYEQTMAKSAAKQTPQSH